MNDHRFVSVLLLFCSALFLISNAVELHFRIYSAAALDEKINAMLAVWHTPNDVTMNQVEYPQSRWSDIVPTFVVATNSMSHRAKFENRTANIVHIVESAGDVPSTNYVLFELWNVFSPVHREYRALYYTTVGHLNDSLTRKSSVTVSMSSKQGSVFGTLELRRV